MRTSAPGSERRRKAAGFTLIELMVVVALTALFAALVSPSLRDPSAAQLDREAARLSVLLESARAEARAAGLQVAWVPGAGVDGDAAAGEGAADFRFVGLPAALDLPRRWLVPGVSADVTGGALQLGPDAILPPQSVRLRLNDRTLRIASDGLGAFAVAPDDAGR